MDNSTNFRITNSKNHFVELRLEPWGDVLTMNDGATFNIHSSGMSNDVVEIDILDNAFVIYAGEGMTMNVFEGNKDLTEGMSCESVRIPKGLLSRGEK